VQWRSECKFKTFNLVIMLSDLNLANAFFGEWEYIYKNILLRRLIIRPTYGNCTFSWDISLQWLVTNITCTVQCSYCQKIRRTDILNSQTKILLRFLMITQKFSILCRTISMHNFDRCSKSGQIVKISTIHAFLSFINCSFQKMPRQLQY